MSPSVVGWCTDDGNQSWAKKVQSQLHWMEKQVRMQKKWLKLPCNNVEHAYICLIRRENLRKTSDSFINSCLCGFWSNYGYYKKGIKIWIEIYSPFPPHNRMWWPMKSDPKNPHDVPFFSQKRKQIFPSKNHQTKCGLPENAWKSVDKPGLKFKDTFHT